VHKFLDVFWLFLAGCLNPGWYELTVLLVRLLFVPMQFWVFFWVFFTGDST